MSDYLDKTEFPDLAELGEDELDLVAGGAGPYLEPDG